MRLKLDEESTVKQAKPAPQCWLVSAHLLLRDPPPRDGDPKVILCPSTTRVISAGPGGALDGDQVPGKRRGNKVLMVLWAS